MTKSLNKLVLILSIGILFSCGENETEIEIEQNNIIGTWQIVSLTADGVEELQEILDLNNVCHWTQVYTKTSLTEIIYSGTSCNTETIDNTYTYSTNGTDIIYETIDDGDVSLEILELTNTTLKIKDSYEELGEKYVDIYTYSRVGNK